VAESTHDPVPASPLASWDLWHVARVAASLLVLMTAAYYVVVAFDNITNPSSNWPFVEGVISEDGVPAGSGFEWRAIDAEWFHVMAYVLIIAAETITGVALLLAGIAGIRRAAHPASWAHAQRLAVAGCVLGLAIYFFGFITVGGNWWVSYLNEEWNGIDPAFQNSVMTAFTLVLVLGVAAADRSSAADCAVHR
jgi:predicted small integral membrane protein